MSLLSLFQLNLLVGRPFVRPDRKYSTAPRQRSFIARARTRAFRAEDRRRTYQAPTRRRAFKAGATKMVINFQSMVPGDDIRFAVDMTGKLPQGANLVGATISMRNGAERAEVTVTVDGVEAIVRVQAEKTGTVTFDVLPVLSIGGNTEVDGQRCSVQIL